MKSLRSKHEKLMIRWKRSPDKVRDELIASGIYEWSKNILVLEKMQYNINLYAMNAMFGSEMGERLWQRFTIEDKRNFISWLVGLGGFLSGEELISVRRVLAENKIDDLSEPVAAIDLANKKINEKHFADIFGEQLGEHLWDKLHRQHGGNVLSLLSKLTSEYRFSVLISLREGLVF